MFLKMKRMISLAAAFAAALCLSFVPVLAEEETQTVTFPDYWIEDHQSLKYVTLGSEGMFEISDGLFLDETLTWDETTFASSDPEVLEVDSDGNWKALGCGSTEVYYDVDLSEDNWKALEEKYPDVQWAKPDVMKGITVTVTEDIPVYRLYNPNSGEHFYTIHWNEKTSLMDAGWIGEGIGWVSAQDETLPVYRLYNPNAGDHHYTMDAAEKDALVAEGWNDEGIAFYSFEEGQPVYRQYNPNAIAGAHNFSCSENERDTLVELGWHDEETAWYAHPDLLP